MGQSISFPTLQDNDPVQQKTGFYIMGTTVMKELIMLTFWNFEG